MSVIEVKGLKKSFGNFEALRARFKSGGTVGAALQRSHNFS